MSIAKAALAALGAACLGGCAIHPVQQDVTGVPTYEVVRRIRCETRIAIVEKAAQLIEKKAVKIIEHAKKENVQISFREKQILGEMFRIASTLRENPSKPDQSIYNELSEPEKRFYEKYIDTGIAYYFSFDISEENKAALAVDPLRLLSGGTAGIGINASSDLTRNNIRRFGMTEKFRHVLFDENLTCENEPRFANFSYPISGEIGMYSVIDTFIDLNQGLRLVETPNAGPGVFADTLKFSTTLIGSASPHFALNPVGKEFGFTGTNFQATASRTDIHQLVIGLSLADPSPPSKHAKQTVRKPSSAFVAPLGNSGNNKPATAFVAPFATPRDQTDGRSPQENRARDAASQQPLLNFYDRLGTLNVR